MKDLIYKKSEFSSLYGGRPCRRSKLKCTPPTGVTKGVTNISVLLQKKYKYE